MWHVTDLISEKLEPMCLDVLGVWMCLVCGCARCVDVGGCARCVFDTGHQGRADLVLAVPWFRSH